jgi:hypothetical protein
MGVIYRVQVSKNADTLKFYFKLLFSKSDGYDMIKVTLIIGGNRMPRGGKRPGAGRKPEGITWKVSLTLTKEEWKQIEESGFPTLAAYLKHLLKNERLKDGSENEADKKESDGQQITAGQGTDQAS